MNDRFEVTGNNGAQPQRNGENHIIEFAPFKLKKGVLASDFLFAQEELHVGYISKCKGFISWKSLYQGDTWVDFVVWETMEDQNNASNGCYENELYHKYISFIDETTLSENSDYLYKIKKIY